MKNIFIFLLLLLSHLVIASDNPLLGKWKSDKEKTLEIIKVSKKLTEKQKEFLINKMGFGELVLEIYENHIVSHYQKEKGVSEYNIISITGNTVTIEQDNEFYGGKLTQTIKLKNDTMFISSEVNSNIVEVFTRIE